jgi:hypothetical protein
VEESPEQVLARLARYQDTLNRAPRSPSSVRRPATPESRVVQWSAATAADELLPASARAGRYSPGSEHATTVGTVRATLFGHLLAVLGCALAVLAFERLDSNVALGVVIAATAAGMVAVARRVPLAVWLTLGVVVGGVLGRWS